ncbi:MAG: aldehyde ferredoxin oxidoreductase family protein [Planctomycetes bacterium]|nr:aldehyde ferredoxin oxidoreductase family protein [Planctomycetota bacterium]
MAVPGTMGKTAFVDLAKGKVEVESPPDELYQKYLGGYGLGAYYLYTRMKRGVKPLSPQNMLGLLAGPLSGTPAICGNRFQAVAKSPKTGGFGDANCGGDFGPKIKFAGLDGIFFTGKAKKPVYVVIDKGAVAIKDAADLWGGDVVATEDKLKALYGKEAAIASIGPAGEAVTLLACIMNDRDRAAGRSGLGAVMGSKRLKAVVAVPSLAIPLADEARMKADRTAYIAKMRETGLFQVFHKFGTSGITAGAVASGDCPVKNWAGSAEDFKTAAKISDEAVHDVVTKPYGCWHCPVACGGFVKTAGPFAVEGGKPEYETLGSFGAMMLMDDLPAICKVNDLCNRNGMDTISTGCTLAFAFECYEEGILTKADTGGLELTWGNAAAMVALTEQIVRRDGLGALLADGAKAAAKRLGKGAMDCAMQIQGEEVPMHDPRLSPGLATSFKLDATPGRHTQFSAWPVEAGFAIAGLEDRYGGWTPDKKYDYTGKAKAHRAQSGLMHAINAEGVCMFGACCLPAQAQVDFLNGAMGRAWTIDDVLAIGDRIANLRIAFNLREGIKNTRLRIPGRIVGRPPLQAGPTKGVIVDLAVQQKEYLDEMGWTQDGVPTADTLRRLGLDFAVPDLHG